MIFFLCPYYVAGTSWGSFTHGYRTILVTIIYIPSLQMMTLQSKEVILVTFCCTTDYPPRYGHLKEGTFIIFQFLRVRSLGAALAEWFWLRVPS